MSVEIFMPWDDQDALKAHLRKLWDEVNIAYYAGAYDWDYQMTKDEVLDFADSVYKHVEWKYYNGSHQSKFTGFDLTARKTSFAGKCRRWMLNGDQWSYSIILNYRWYIDWGWEQMMDTILHEIGHMTYWDHDVDFWQEGRRIGYGMEMPGWKPRMAKYRMYCPHCDNQWFYLSKPKQYRCGGCYPDWHQWYMGTKEWMIIEKNTDPDRLV
jgi:hypothetical protein